MNNKLDSCFIDDYWENLFHFSKGKCEFLCFINKDAEKQNKNFSSDNISQFFLAKSPFRKIGHFIKRKTIDPMLQQFCLSSTYSNSQIRRLKEYENGFITLDLLNKYNDFFEIHLIDDIRYPMKFKENEELVHAIHSIVYVIKEFKQILQHGNCLELDASFFVLAPYVYCIPQIIINNESVPIGFVAGPTESKHLYLQLYKFIFSIDEHDSFEKIKNLPVLSDEGSALIALCNELGLIQYFCYHHIIKKFGANSKLGGLVKGLIFSQNKEEFLEKWNLYTPSIIEALNTTTPLHIKQFEDWFLTKFNPSDQTLSTPQFDTQSLWNRGTFHIPTCTNHNESAHSHLNSNTSSCRLYNKRIDVILKYIHDKSQTFWQRRNLSEYLHSLRKQKKDQISYCKVCKSDEYKNNLYSINLPCPHTVKNFHIEEYYFEKLYPVEGQSIQIIRKINEDECLWNFPERKCLPLINLTPQDLLLLQSCGKPLFSYYSQIKQMLPSDLKGATDDEKNIFLETLFVHFSAQYFGEYNYSDSMLQYFYEYTISKIFRTKNFTIPYDTQKRDENLHLLTIKINSHVSTLEEYDNNTCQDQFTSSQEIDNSQNSNEDYQNIEKEIENDSAEDNQELQKNEMIKNDDNILISPINLEESEDKGFNQIQKF